MTTEPVELVLRPRRTKWLLVALGGAGFVACGCLMFQTAGAASDRIIAGLVIAFFGAVTLVGILQLVPGASFLRISSAGLLVRNLWRDTLYRWSDIETFGVAEVVTVHYGMKRRHHLVGFNFSPTSPLRARRTGLKSLNRALSGFEAALPDNYGHNCAELVKHLNELRTCPRITPCF